MIKKPSQSQKYEAKELYEECILLIELDLKLKG